MNFFFKIIFIASILFSYSNAFTGGLWSKQNSPTSAFLFNCTFADTLNGWAAGDSGIIIHTSNGGSNWIIQNNPVDYYINDIFFINKRLGWAVANEFLLNGTTILKTTNGGNNWTAESFPDSSKIFRTIYFRDSLNGYLGGFGGAIFKTTDAGNSWSVTMNDSSAFANFPIAKFKFVSDNLGFACGGHIDIAGVIWKTTNSGLFWEAEDLSPEPFYAMYIKDSLRILAVGGDFEFGAQLIRTSNAGLNWVYESLGLFGQSQSIDFRTPNEAWMPLGFAQTWAVSYDSGSTWSSIPTIDSSMINSVVFVDALHGWAVGSEGTILKYNPQTVAINTISSNIPMSIFLYQNYPNPFNPNTIIHYQLPMFSDVKLKIYDVLGKEVVTLVNEKQNAGSYNVEFSATGEGINLSSGVYFYRLVVTPSTRGNPIEAINFTQTKRMVLIR